MAWMPVGETLLLRVRTAAAEDTRKTSVGTDFIIIVGVQIQIQFQIQFQGALPPNRSIDHQSFNQKFLPFIHSLTHSLTEYLCRGRLHLTLRF